jgi:hypothetical protein
MSVTVTLAPAIAAPLWSVTVPEILPWLPCEKSETDAKNNNRPAPRMEQALTALVLLSARRFSAKRIRQLNMEASLNYWF